MSQPLRKDGLSEAAGGGRAQMIIPRVIIGKIVLGLGFVTLSHAQVAYPAERADAEALVVGLNRYADLIGRKLQPDEVAQLEGTRSSRWPGVQALSAALLYRVNPRKYSSELSTHFVVQDYSARARGEKNHITQEQFVEKIKQVEQAYPSLKPSLPLVVCFVRLRDANLWFMKGDQEISVARFLRGAFLGLAFKGSGLDAVSVANELDEEARREQERAGGSKR